MDFFGGRDLFALRICSIPGRYTKIFFWHFFMFWDISSHFKQKIFFEKSTDPISIYTGSVRRPVSGLFDTLKVLSKLRLSIFKVIYHEIRTKLPRIIFKNCLFLLQIITRSLLHCLLNTTEWNWYDFLSHLADKYKLHNQGTRQIRRENERR